uniref:Uncharacterized protein n=1 Tax=Globodera rostochiensis TaxID=31243 RepID=A0A914HQ05_GLORO
MLLFISHTQHFIAKAWQIIVYPKAKSLLLKAKKSMINFKPHKCELQWARHAQLLSPKTSRMAFIIVSKWLFLQCANDENELIDLSELKFQTLNPCIFVRPLHRKRNSIQYFNLNCFITRHQVPKISVSAFDSSFKILGQTPKSQHNDYFKQ